MTEEELKEIGEKIMTPEIKEMIEDIQIRNILRPFLEKAVEEGIKIGEQKLTEKDKQIEELEGQVTRAFEVLESKRKQIEELQSKVNNYHTWVDKIKELKCVRLGKCTHEQERLEAQIEKMKCCENCKKYFKCGSSRYVCEEWSYCNER